MEKRLKLALLLDFYGPLLTERKRDIVRLYCEEDMSCQEIAEQMGISRQGAYDAIRSAQAQLARYDRLLGLMSRHMAIRREVMACRARLMEVKPTADTVSVLAQAKAALERIEWVSETAAEGEVAEHGV